MREWRIGGGKEDTRHIATGAGQVESSQKTEFEVAHAAIVVAAEKAYGVVAGREGRSSDGIHHEGTCHKVTKEMLRPLRDAGYEVSRKSYDYADLADHSYLVLNISGEEIVIDPTWQQFLPESKISSKLPKVLVGTREQVIAQADHYGVGKAKRFWVNKDDFIDDEGFLGKDQRLPLQNQEFKNLSSRNDRTPQRKLMIAILQVV